MITEEISVAIPLKTEGREWCILPDSLHPERFRLWNSKGELLCTFFVHQPKPGLLNCIAAAPELQDIAEMFRDHMLGSAMHHTMLFTLVQNLLNRLK